MQTYKFVFSLIPPGVAAPASWVDDPNCKQCVIEVPDGDSDEGWNFVRREAAREYPDLELIPHFRLLRGTAPNH